jgi:hypothetical protein
MPRLRHFIPRQLGLRWRARGRERYRLAGQAERGEQRIRERRVGHDGDDTATPTARALQHVVREHAAQQLGHGSRRERDDDGELLRVEDHRVLYVVTKQVLCVDYRTGRLLWSAPIPWQRPRVLAYAGCVVLADVGEAMGISLQDGSQLWHDKFPGYGIYGGAMAAPGVTAPIDQWK